MLETIFHKQSTIERHQQNYLFPFYQDYIAYLKQRGYTNSTIAHYLPDLSKFGNWLKRKKIALDTIATQDPQALLNAYLKSNYLKGKKASAVNNARAAIKKFFFMIRADDPYRTLSTEIADYQRYLVNVKGLAENTCTYRRAHALEFINYLEKINLAFNSLTPEVIIGYVQSRSENVKPGMLKRIVCCLRCFLRYLLSKNLLKSSLIAALPSIQHRTHIDVPATLSDQQVQEFLNAFDLSCAVQLRDYTMARFIVDLGLRCDEVASIQIEDIDLKKRTLTLRKSKSRRGYCLPILEPLLNAIKFYLLKGRPETSSSHLFVYHRAPLGHPVKTATVRGAIRRAFHRADMDEWAGTHIFRRTLATRMLQKGASFKDIADVLRHGSIDTVHIYAKVDIPKLRDVVMPWPRRQS